MKFMKNEEDAVSPVIGVILMVAITVILAAVIAAFVFGLGGGVAKTKNVAVTVKQINDTGAEITMQGGADFSGIKNVTWQIAAQDCPTLEAPTIGQLMGCDEATTESDHVIVVGNFLDGSSQVLLDTYI